MLEIVVCSLFVGTIGLQTVVLGSWMHWQYVVVNQDQEEEEILTQYETKENARELAPQPNGVAPQQSKDPRLVGWEFKIVRASRDVFRDSAVLQKLCQEEAESGWIMLEKLDDHRVRFKRPIAMREVMNPEFMKYEPYRSHYGTSWQPWSVFGAIALLAAMILPAVVGYVVVSHALASSNQTQLPATFPPREPSTNR